MKYLDKLKEFFIIGFNGILEPWGRGWDWTYYNKEFKIWNGWKNEYDFRTVNLTFRKNTISGNLYYRTQRPRFNGYDDNKWIPTNNDDLGDFHMGPKKGI